ncbi:MAG: lysophospholipid acyltransferase family protein [Armatimonadota bacterium]
MPKPPRQISISLLRWFIGFPLLTLLGPIRIRNKKNVPRAGGLIVLSNHISDCDPVVSQLACPRGMQFMSKSELWDIKLLGKIMAWWGNFSVKRGEPDRTSLRIASELAKAGAVVCIYPEGQISEDGKLQPLKAGAALIVRMAGVPVICCGMKGNDKIMPYAKLIPRPAFSWVTATWGEAKTFGDDATNEDIIAWAEAELRRLIPDPVLVSLK